MRAGLDGTLEHAKLPPDTACADSTCRWSYGSQSGLDNYAYETAYASAGTHVCKHDIWHQSRRGFKIAIAMCEPQIEVAAAERLIARKA